MASSTATEEWFTAEEVVARFKLASVNSLYALRSRGRGPKGHKFGRELRFRNADLEAWVNERADSDDR